MWMWMRLARNGYKWMFGFDFDLCVCCGYLGCGYVGVGSCRVSSSGRGVGG